MMKLLQAFALLLFSATAAYAQSAPANAPAVPVAPPAAGASAPVITEAMKQPFAGSFFFTPLEIKAIQDALNGKVTPGALISRGAVTARQIRVAGVLYKSPSNWVVWMNNHKVTPEDKLPEIVDISVKRSSNVSLKWYDSESNRILMITMRPHETYDINTGILLPQ